MPRFAATLFLVTSCLVIAVSAGAQTRDKGTFDIYFRGLKAAQLSYSAVEQNNSYSAAARLRAAGIAGLVTSVTYEANSQGQLSSSKFTPRRYEEIRTRKGNSRRSLMNYRNGVPQGRVQEPPRTPKPEDIDPLKQGGTLDVLSAIYSTFRPMSEDQTCQFDTPVFDGERRSQITSGAKSNSGGAITCNATYRRVAGYSAEDLADGTSFAFTLTYEPRGDGLWQVNRVDMKTIYGNGRMVRR